MQTETSKPKSLVESSISLHSSNFLIKNKIIHTKKSNWKCINYLFIQWISFRQTISTLGENSFLFLKPSIWNLMCMKFKTSKCSYVFKFTKKEEKWKRENENLFDHLQPYAWILYYVDKMYMKRTRFISAFMRITFKLLCNKSKLTVNYLYGHKNPYVSKAMLSMNLFTVRKNMVKVSFHNSGTRFPPLFVLF